MKEKSSIERSPHFNKFMRIFDTMRVEGGVKYRELHKRIVQIQPGISYDVVYAYFRKFGDGFLIKNEIHRAALREKKKRIADKALDEVEADPKKLPIDLRIRLGESATKEELQEAGLIIRDKSNQVKEDLLDKLIDKARYGEVIEAEKESYIDKQTKNKTLPNPNVSER